MITAAEIMAGGLPKTRRVFTVKGIGEIELYRLSIAETSKGMKLCSKSKELDEAGTEELEQHIINAAYYMLHGEYNDEQAQKLLDLLDNEQIGNIYNTGLFYIDTSHEDLEKNSPSNLNSEP